MSRNLVTIREAAEYLRCHRTTLWRLVRRGEFGYYRVGSRTLYEQGELDAFLDRRRVEPRGTEAGPSYRRPEVVSSAGPCYVGS